MQAAFVYNVGCLDEHQFFLAVSLENDVYPENRLHVYNYEKCSFKMAEPSQECGINLCAIVS